MALTANTDVGSVTLITTQAVAPTIPDATQGLVVAGWSSAQAYARQAYQEALDFLHVLQSLSENIAAIPYINTNLASVSLNLEKFDLLLGELPANPSDVYFYAEGSDYSSLLLTSVTDLLKLWVGGASTGISPTVEAAIWSREQAREIVASNKKKVEVVKQFAVRGFIKPPGAFAVQLLEAEQQAQDNIISASRDIAIKQADLEQSNRRFALDLAWKVEQGLMQYRSDRQKRLLEHAKYLQSYLIDIFQAKLAAYNADVLAYGTRINAEVSLHRAEIDRLIAEANLRLETAKTNLQAMIQKVQLLVEDAKAGAQISAQLAAAALSAVNLSGGLHDSSSNAATTSASSQASVSESVGYTGQAVYSYTPLS